MPPRRGAPCLLHMAGDRRLLGDPGSEQPLSHSPGLAGAGEGHLQVPEDWCSARGTLTEAPQLAMKFLSVENALYLNGWILLPTCLIQF